MPVASTFDVGFALSVLGVDAGNTETDCPDKALLLRGGRLQAIVAGSAEVYPNLKTKPPET